MNLFNPLMKRNRLYEKIENIIVERVTLPETLEKILKDSGCCDMCKGYFECDCPKNFENGPKKLQMDMTRMDYDLNLSGGA